MRLKKDEIISKKLGSVLEIVVGAIITLNIIVIMTPLGASMGYSENLAYHLCEDFGYTDPIVRITGIIYLVSLISAVFGGCALISGVISLFSKESRAIRILKIIAATLQVIVVVMAIILFLTYFNNVQYALINHVHMKTIRIWYSFTQIRILIQWIAVLIYLIAIISNVVLIIRQKIKIKNQ